jgi:SHS2 domain-containing protein
MTARRPVTKARRSDRTKRRPPYTLFPHTADVGARVDGRTLRRLFENAALALLDLGGDRDAVRARRRVAIAVQGTSLEDLLVRWLSEILFLQEIRGWRFRTGRVENLDRRRLRLRGAGLGEMFDARRHGRGREVKAVTYHRLRVVRRAGRWSVRIVFDV